MIRRLFAASPKNLKCTVCTQPMAVVQLRRNYYYLCSEHGVWTTISFFSVYKNFRSIIDRIYAARERVLVSAFERACPSCQRPMIATQFSREPEIVIDQCLGCNGIWFDKGELNEMDNKGELEDEFPFVPPIRKSELPNDLGSSGRSWPSQTELPADTSFHPLMLLGFPVVDSDRKAAPVSLVFFLVAAFSSVMTYKGLHSKAYVIENLYWPAEPLRRRGLNLITSTLLHGNISHLFGNLYFLFISANPIEEVMGFVFVFILFFGSAVAGHAAYSFIGAQEPSLGASGGVTGVLVYFALAFPRTRFRIGYLVNLRYVGLSFSALEALCLYGGLQIAFASLQVAGFGSGVNYVAHLGGAAIGILAYVLIGSPSEKSKSG